MPDRKIFLKKILLSIEKNIDLKTKSFKSYEPNKGYTSDLDIKINNFLHKNIKKTFPNDIIISEEETSKLKHNYSNYRGNVWVIDPVCGTTNQVRQIPFFANSLSVILDNGTISSGIYDPNRSELFYTDGKKTYLNNKLVTVSKVKKLKDAVIAINCNQSSNKSNRNKIENLIQNVAPPLSLRVKIFESANLELAYLASGRIDAYINPDDKIWDILAGSQLIENAGGQFSTLKGSIDKPFKEIKGVIAGNKYIYKKIKNLFI